MGRMTLVVLLGGLILGLGWRVWMNGSMSNSPFMTLPSGGNDRTFRQLVGRQPAQEMDQWKIVTTGPPDPAGSSATRLMEDLDPVEVEPIETEYRSIGEYLDPDASEGVSQEIAFIGEMIDADCVKCAQLGSSELPEGKVHQIGKYLDANEIEEKETDQGLPVRIGDPLDADGDSDL